MSIDRLTIAKLAHLPTKQIADRLAISERTVQRALNFLRDSGTPVQHGSLRGRPPTEIVHGGPTGYRKGCKCPKCRTKHAEIMRNQRVKRKSKGLPPGDPRHGTNNGAVNWGCPCPACKAQLTVRNARLKATTPRS